MKNKPIKILVFILLLMGLTFYGYNKVESFFAIDGCLDKGGCWNYELERCE